MTAHEGNPQAPGHDADRAKLEDLVADLIDKNARSGQPALPRLPGQAVRD